MKVRFRLLLIAALALACATPKPVVEEKPKPAQPTPEQLKAAAAADATLAVPTFRLPDTVRPLKYSAELTIDPSKDTFSGGVEIELQVNRTIKALWLNGTDLNVEAASLIINGELFPLEQLKGNADFVGFTAGKYIPEGRMYFRAHYTGKISSNGSSGIFRQKEGDDWYAFTQFEPFYARRAFLCFDEPDMKVPWDVSIHVPEKMLAASNQPIDTETRSLPGMKMVKFKITRPIPSYLVAFAVGPFDVLDVGPLGAAKRPTRILTPRGRAQEGKVAADQLPHLISRLEAYFGIALPYDKLDLVAVPLFQGAMENPGLITYSDDLLLAKPEEDTPPRERRLAAVSAHELAHYWFGDLVTLKWWDDTWLNESFAEWLATKVIRDWKPSWETDVQHVAEHSRAMSADALVAAKAVHQPANSMSDIINAFDGDITYSKGEAVLSMVEAYAGADKVGEGVRKYIKTFAWRNAEAKDFIAALAESAGKEVTPVLEGFVNQPGVPLVKMGVDCTHPKPSLVLSQSRFLPTAQAGDQGWQIPICVRYGAGKESNRECTLLTSKNATYQLTDIEGCPDWLYPNEAQTGYYRSELAAEPLGWVREHVDALTVPEQVGFVGDLRALMGGGEIPAAEVLKLVPKLADSKSRYVVVAAAGLVNAVHGDLVPPELDKNFQRFLAKTLGKRAKALGLTAGKKDTEEIRMMRPLLWTQLAEVGADPAAVADAKKLAAKWLSDQTAVAADMVPAVLGLAGRYADAAFNDKLLAAAKAAKDRHDRELILTAMGGAKDPALVKKNLQLLISGDFDVREAHPLLMGPLRDPATRDQGYQFLKDNWDEISKRLPPEAQRYLVMAAAAFCDKAHRDDAEAFFKIKTATVPGADKNLAKALERVDQCVATREKQSKSVADFLKTY